MSTHPDFRNSRRRFLAGTGAAAAALALPLRISRAAIEGHALVARPSRAHLVGGAYPDTAVWAYNGAVPGPELRVRQGDRLRVAVENALDMETTVHWHGLRVPNAMDGVPHLTQAPIAPGESFVYEFDVPDAGTYWYHPHQHSAEQVGRGLYGPLIVEEHEPIRVDREITWVLDDWRLMRDASISADFANMHDMSHDGRIGNTVTINGRIPETFAVRGGERIRLRLINAANARNFSLRFRGHRPVVVARDGQPVEPHEAPEDGVVLGPAMRVDLALDMTGGPGERYEVIDAFYEGRAFRLVELSYEAEPLRGHPLDAPVALAPNTMPEPELAGAIRHEIVLGGGAMGGLRTATMDGRRVDIREMVHNGKAWAINGVVATGHVMDPVLRLERGRTYVLALANDTSWHHPMHLHGHSFRVISRNGQPTKFREWQDTVLMKPRDQVEVAFVADNPGDWMFHCHILEHQAAGMTSVIHVT
ncbi:MAG: multicopper oxidase family protein [Gammaproteobacteria bacterium]|nr:multicopper oxidase family protein [Gammaproteobacteria bacterium]